jgi:hypothetical protein
MDAAGAVTSPTNGQDQRWDVRIGLDLQAQPTDVDIEQPSVTEVVIAPHTPQKVLAGDNLAASRGQLRQQPELGTGQVDISGRAVPIPANNGLVRTDLDVTDTQERGVSVGAAAAQQGTNPGGNLPGHDGFGDIVIGAGLEAADDVRGVRSGGDDDDRQVALRAQPTSDGEPVDAG